jgi:hypothetical protein
MATLNFTVPTRQLDAYGDNRIAIVVSSDVTTVVVKLRGYAFMPGDTPSETVSQYIARTEHTITNIRTNGSTSIAYTWNGYERGGHRILAMGQYENYYLQYEIYGIDANGTETAHKYTDRDWLRATGFEVYGTNGIQAAPWVSLKDSDTLTEELTNDSRTFIKYVSDVYCYLYHDQWTYYTETAGTRTYFKVNNGSQAGYHTASSSLGPNIAYGGIKELIVEKIDNNIFEYEFWATDDETTEAKEHDHAFCNLAIPADKFVNYTKLSCNVSVGAVSTDGTAEVTIYGVFFDDTFGEKGVQNAIQSLVLTYYSVNEVNNPHTVALDIAALEITDNNYVATYTVGSLDPAQRYTFSATVADKAMTATSNATHQSIIHGTPTFDWGANDFRFNVPVNIANGGLTIQNGNLTVNGKINFAATNNQAIPTFGTWEPTINVDYLAGTFGRSGTYMRVGNVCTVNFYFEVTPLANSEMYLKIGGLPYPPASTIPAYAGGGFLHGYNTQMATNDNNIFVGWSIEIDPEATGTYKQSYILGRTSEISATMQNPESSYNTLDDYKRSWYVSGTSHGFDQTPIIGSGTITYRIAEGY